MNLGEKQEKTASPETSKNLLGSTGIGATAVNSGSSNSTSDCLGLIYRSLMRMLDGEREDKKNKLDQQKKENQDEEDRNQFLIKALTSRRKPKKEKIKSEKSEKVTPKEEPKVTTPTPSAKTTTPAPKVETPKVEVPKPTTPTSKETTPPSIKPVEAKPNAPISEKVSSVSRVIKSAASISSVTKLADSGVDISSDKINPELQSRITTMATDFKGKTGKTLMITSGYRSNEKQKQLWDAKMAQTGDPAATRKLVAEPMPPLGSGAGSPHMRGMAIDINSKGAEGLNTLAGSRTSSTGWLESFGLVRPVANEDWHIQMSGTTPVGDGKLVPNKTGSAIEVSTGQTKISSSDIDKLSKENAILKEKKKSSSSVTNNNTDINEEVKSSGSSQQGDDRSSYSQKTASRPPMSNDSSAYSNKARS